MPTEIKYGVVVDNNDIHQTGKIRILLIGEDIPSTYRSKSINELKNLLYNLDVAGNYVPWQKSTLTKKADPYLADAFLPKSISIIPDEGQLVKIITYPEANYKEYIGPHITSLDNQKEGYVNAVNAFKTTNKTDLITKGFTNKVSDVSFYGTNSQLILSDKELFLRTNSQENNGKKKNPKLSLFQQSTFNKTYSVVDKKSTTIQTPDTILTHILNVKVVKKQRDILNEKTVIATLQLLSVINFKNRDGKIGVTTSSYNAKNDYGSDIELEFIMSTDDMVEVSNFIIQLNQSLLKRSVPQLLNQSQVGDVLQSTTTTPTYDLIVNDYRQMTANHVVITDRKAVDVISLVVTMDKNQINYPLTTDTLTRLGVSQSYSTTNVKFYAKEMKNLSLINDLTTKYQNNFKVESNILNVTPKIVDTIESDVTLDGDIDSYSVIGSKKIILASTQITPNLISNKPTQYGLTQKELTNLIDPKALNTFSSVRGERLIEVINQLIDLFLQHGHSTGVTVKNSMEEDTRNKLVKIKEELSKKVNPDLSGGTNLLNQYIRIN